MPDPRGPLAPITMQPNYNFHLELLEEWNEEHVFLPITSVHMLTDRGIMVMQEVQMSYRQMDYKWDEDEQREKYIVQALKPIEVIQLCAVYGDEDSLAKLVIFKNQAGGAQWSPGAQEWMNLRGVEILVDHTIRA